MSGAAGALGYRLEPLAAEAPPETTRLRIAEIPSACRSPEWAADALLRMEGFTDIQFSRVAGTAGVERGLATGEIDISGHFAAPVILQTVAVRHEPPGLSGEALDAHTLAWVDRVNRSGEALITPAQFDGRWVARVSIGALETSAADVAALWDLMRREAEREDNGPA